MPCRSKHKPPKNAIVLGDVVFKLGIRIVRGVIHGQQGMAVFICEEEGIAEPLPFFPPIEAYDNEATSYIRTYDKSIVLELGRDDKFIEDIDSNRGEIDVTDPQLIASLFEKQKLRIIPDVLSGLGTTVITGVVALIMLLTSLPRFPFMVVPACISIWGAFWTLSCYKHLSRPVAYDARGNWINLDTGKTSLNDGQFSYKVERPRRRDRGLEWEDID